MYAVATSFSHTLASAIKAATMDCVIILSSIGTERSSSMRCILTTHTLKEVLKNIASQVVIVRCAWFIENWLDATSAVKSRHLSAVSFMSQKLDRTSLHIATNDIVRVVVKCMTKPNDEVDKLVTIEWEAPESYSPNDVVKVTSEALEKPISSTAMLEKILM